MTTLSNQDSGESVIVSRTVIATGRDKRWGKAALAMIVLVAVGAGFWFYFGDSWHRHQEMEEGAIKEEASQNPLARADGAESTAGLVRLAQSEIDAAQLRVDNIERRSLQETRKVPGRIGYNENQYLPVTSPVRGIVRKVHVLPGQEVRQGDLLAVVSSAEIGGARSDLLMKQEELELATQRYQWEDQIQKNIQTMLDQLQTRPEAAIIEKAFAGKLLGDHRSDILTAYAKLRLAEITASRTDPLAKQGVVSGRVVQQRRSDRDVASADFQSIREATRISCLEQRDRAQAELNDARRRLAVSQEHLSALCNTLSPAGKIDEAALNELQLLAPISGQITRKNVVPSARVDITDPLFILADTKSLWVSAQLREQDWESLRAVPGQTVQLQIPALGDKEFTAKIRFIGAEVSDQTRALPLVAELENSDTLLKPGLFAWVSIPMGTARTCMAVPAASVLRHEGRTFVFVQQQPGCYYRQDVAVGLETPDWTEILAGVEVGQEIVDQGAFCLKSELLLDGEE